MVGGFVNSDRVTCTSEAVGNKADAEADPPSYVDLLTCIQDAQLARKLPKNYKGGLRRQTDR
jgi:hypothetical protein